MVGAVAVKHCRQTVLPLAEGHEPVTTAARAHLALRRIYNDAITAKLSRASFPQSLLPTTRLDHEQKEPR